MDWRQQHWLGLVPSSGMELQVQDTPSSASRGRAERRAASYGASALWEATAKGDVCGASET